LGCEKEKIKVHRMGIHVESFRFREREIKRDGRINILTIGRLVEKKGHEYAIRAMAKVIKRFPRVRYLIAGGGPLMKPLKDQSKNLGIDRQVRFYGECNQDEVVKLYELAHIFLLPSVTSSQGDQEGIPMVLMEAQAVGLPIVSTCHSGIPEGIRNGESGFLVSEKNVDAIADRIYYLIEHPRKCGRMGREGRRWIENEFDQKKLDSRLIQFYECLLKVNTP
jgi:colanic acid/amylovoran biosynthesis glycosyltransferase